MKEVKYTQQDLDKEIEFLGWLNAKQASVEKELAERALTIAKTRLQIEEIIKQLQSPNH